MSHLKGKDWARGTLLVALTGAALACGERATEPRAVAAPTQGSEMRTAFSSWSPAASIETALAGAHPNFNTAFAEGCPFVGRSNRIFFIASNRPHRPGETGPVDQDVWFSTRESEDEPWGAPVNAGETLNSTANDFCPTLARDGHTFYFVSNRQAGVQGVDWCGGGDIYVSRFNADGTFEPPKNIGCDINSPQDEFSPFPIPDDRGGPALYFSSTRPRAGGVGGDLYVSKWHGGGYQPATLVPNVNSDVDDGQPNVRHDGLELYFYSRRTDLPGAQGGADLYVSTRETLADEWSTPENLGAVVNKAGDETRPSLSWDGTTLYFGSVRPGGEGSNDIYVTTRSALSHAD